MKQLKREHGTAKMIVRTSKSCLDYDKSGSHMYGEGVSLSGSTILLYETPTSARPCIRWLCRISRAT